MSWATSVPTLALLSWPVTAWGGAVLSYNILTLLAPALLAWAGYLLLLELTEDMAASLIGGYLVGFSSYELGQISNELNLDMVFLLPLALLLCVRRMRGKTNAARFIVYLALLALAQLGISTEILATTSIFGFLLWLSLLLFAPDERRKLLVLALEVASSAALSLCLAAPFLHYLVQGLDSTPPIINSPFFASVDVVTIFLPSKDLHSLGQVVAAVLREFAGYSPGSGSVLGIPLVLGVCLYFREAWRSSAARGVLVMVLLAIILSIGPVLNFNARHYNVPMPWSVALHVPVIRSILPGRLILYAGLGAAIAVGLWMARAGAGRARALRLAFGLVCCLPQIAAGTEVLPQPWRPVLFGYLPERFTWTKWPEQALFTPENVRKSLGKDAIVLFIPAPNYGPGMALQLNAAMGFKQAGGYVGFIPVPEQKWAFLSGLGQSPPGPNFADELSAYCAARHVDFVVVSRDAAMPVSEAVRSLHWPALAESEGLSADMEIFIVPRAAAGR